MDLYDIILAGKVNGGGGGGTLVPLTPAANGFYDPVNYSSDGFSSVDVRVPLSQYQVTANSFATLTIPAIQISGMGSYPLFRLYFMFMGTPAQISLMRMLYSSPSTYTLQGGVITDDGTDGAVINLRYTEDVQGVTVCQAGQISSGTYTDITAYMGAATNIMITWYGPDSLS